MPDDTHRRPTAADAEQRSGQTGRSAGCGQRLVGVGRMRVQSEDESDVGRVAGGKSSNTAGTPASG